MQNLLEELPTETLLSIFLSLPSLSDILAFCSTYPRFAAFCREDYFWKLLVERDFPYAFSKTKKPRSWKRLYQELYAFSNSFLYLTLTKTYRHLSIEDDEEEWLNLSWEVRTLLENIKAPFYIPSQNPSYEIEEGKIVFYFQILPTEPDLTFHDFLSFFSSWKKEVREANRRGEEFLLSLGKPGYYLEEV